MGEKVLVLASRLKKKDSPGNFYRSSVDNKFYSHKSETFLIISRQNFEENFFYWLKPSKFGKEIEA